jgi:ribosome-binding protein aMBF1 (putative translation factor)
MPEFTRENAPGHDGMELLEEWFPTTPENVESREHYANEFDVAQLVYDARTAAGLTQKELAEKIGTKPSAISRLEDADYRGHSMSMLRRVAKALGKRVVVRLEDEVETSKQAPPVATEAREAVGAASSSASRE